MATHSSAIKRHTQSLKRRAANRSNRSRLRTQLKRLRETVAGKDLEAARRLLPGTIALIDRSIQKGVLHENAAARHKSRLTRLVNSLAASGKSAGR
ncbi:MAG TPA: 30S ribosomal protein S20 [Candidatus Polarisedimenticolia bacterium]|nr:30S ribosomal protein S20 [Candidatus Polarisedimenticolia bacterium]